MVLICEFDLADSHAVCEMSFFSPQLDPSLSLEAEQYMQMRKLVHLSHEIVIAGRKMISFSSFN